LTDAVESEPVSETPVALVTGAASGIGRACAERFAEDGWRLVLVDRREEELGALAGEDVVTLAGDVAASAANDAAVDAAVTRFGRLDAAVANAGVALAALVDDSTDEDFDRLFGVNVRAVMHLAKAAHRPLAESKGSLTVMASKTGLVAQTNSPLYCATKGAAIQLARALALDWAPEGIRVNAVCPGMVDTPMLAEYIEDLPDPETEWEKFRSAQPLGRLATPREIADVVLFLSTPAAAFVTGVALPVDGGFTAE
jgi:meso-butanediol dehydrogenase / (S,S)-butanediol dehydrogenase / diacetyl reductase